MSFGVFLPSDAHISAKWDIFKGCNLIESAAQRNEEAL